MKQAKVNLATCTTHIYRFEPINNYV